MPNYRRAFQPGGTFFFTLVTNRRRGFLCHPKARKCLHTVLGQVQSERPFEMMAIVLLPNHFHCVWKLPEGDTDFSTRWACIKKDFTKLWLAAGGCEESISSARLGHRERGVWQRRFWEHTVRNEDDLHRHVDYIHYNPVKHGLAACPHQWPYSSFQRWVSDGYYNKDWLCNCNLDVSQPPDFDDIMNTVGQ